MNEGVPRVLIAGAGVAGLEAALALRALAESELSVELLAPEAEFVYRPLAVTEPFGVGEVRRFPLSTLAEAAGARLRTGSVAAVDAERKLVTLADGRELGYEMLLLALGAHPREAVVGALTFRGPQDSPALAGLLDRATAGEVRRIAFAVPAGASWPLPLYELALLTAEYLSAHGTRGVELVLVSPEDYPLALFGPTASKAVTELLAGRGITVKTSVVPIRFEKGMLRIVAEPPLAVDAVVALPQLEGPRLPGVPQDEQGFVPTDQYMWVSGLSGVYAAGDLTQFPLKQGGIASQQADVAAASIAADAGAAVRTEPFRPVLRGLLLTGFVPRFLRAEATGAHSTIDTEPLWWPPRQDRRPLPDAISRRQARAGRERRRPTPRGRAPDRG
jgi:sulfide:quinone oxidoreductase